MDEKRFQTIAEDQIERCKKTLFRKAAEYASTRDRLHNFKVASGLQGVSMAQALAGMMVKHTVSVFDMCRDHKPNQAKEFQLDLWEEKITDHINYLILLKAVVMEELNEKHADRADRANGGADRKILAGPDQGPGRDGTEICQSGMPGSTGPVSLPAGGEAVSDRTEDPEWIHEQITKAFEKKIHQAGL